MSQQKLPATETAERRIYSRHPCNLTVLAGCEPCIARVHNLSRDGICFFIGHQVDAQCVVSLELFNAVTCVWHLKGAKVIHSAPQPDGTWLVGVAFLRGLTDAELQDLLQSPPIPDATDTFLPPQHPGPDVGLSPKSAAATEASF